MKWRSPMIARLLAVRSEQILHVEIDLDDAPLLRLFKSSITAWINSEARRRLRNTFPPAPEQIRFSRVRRRCGGGTRVGCGSFAGRETRATVRPRPSRNRPVVQESHRPLGSQGTASMSEHRER